MLVKESQLEALTLANSMGELRMNLRPFGEDNVEGADNGESFLSWINENDESKPQPVKQEQVVAVNNSLATLFPARPPAPDATQAPDGDHHPGWFENLHLE